MRRGRTCRQFEVGDRVMSRDYRGDLKWRSGLVVRKTGPLMYEAQVAPGIILRRHIDQLQPTRVEPNTVEISLPEVVDVPPAQNQQSAPPDVKNSVADQPEMVPVPSPVVTPVVVPVPSPVVTSEVTPVSPKVRERRDPQRVRRAPQRLDL